MKGKFVRDDVYSIVPVFVFASTRSEYERVVRQIKQDDPDESYDFQMMWNPDDWLKLEVTTFPVLVLPENWLDNPQIADYRFRNLVAFGHP